MNRLSVFACSKLYAENSFSALVIGCAYNHARLNTFLKEGMTDHAKELITVLAQKDAALLLINRVHTTTNISFIKIHKNSIN